MRLIDIGRWIRSRWLVAVAAVVLVAFTAGLAFGLSGADRTVAQEGQTTAGSSTKPATGNYLYLPDIDRYFSLPDDVKRVKKIHFGTCNSETRCPVFPFLIYQRGEARIGIDQVGEVFETVENGDASAFPFFTGEEDE